MDITPSLPPPPPPPPPPILIPYSPYHPYGERFAGFGIRFGAYILDQTVLGLIIVGILTIGGALSPVCPVGPIAVHPNCIGGNPSPTPLFLVVSVVAIAYLPVCWGLGATLGQRLLGLRVADAATGLPIGIARGFLRLLGFWIAALPLYLGLIWVAFDERYQSWHDKIARTVVLRRA